MSHFCFLRFILTFCLLQRVLARFEFAVTIKTVRADLPVLVIPRREIAFLSAVDITLRSCASTSRERGDHPADRFNYFVSRKQLTATGSYYTYAAAPME